MKVNGDGPRITAIGAGDGTLVMGYEDGSVTLVNLATQQKIPNNSLHRAVIFLSKKIWSYEYQKAMIVSIDVLKLGEQGETVIFSADSNGNLFLWNPSGTKSNYMLNYRIEQCDLKKHASGNYL